MNYSENVKSDILKNLESDSNSCYAFVCAVTKCLGNLAIYKTGATLEYEIKQEGFALQLAQMIKQLYGCEVDFCFKVGSKIYTIKVSSNNANKILKDMGLSRYEQSKLVWTSGLDFKKRITNRLMAQSYMQGVFMSVGSLYMPDDILSKGGYQAELLFTQEDYAQAVVELLKECGLNFQLSDRGNSYVAYSKNSEVISDFLAFVRAMNSVIELNDIMLKRDVNNNINRQTNVFVANTDKLLQSNNITIGAIDKIKRTVGLDKLDPKLEYIAIERTKDHQESMGQLAVRLNISKTTLSRYLAKIKQFAEEINE